MLDLENFGEIIDKAITENHVQLLIDMPEGTQEPNVKGTGVATIDCYILLAAIRPVFCRVIQDMGGTEKVDAPRVLDGMWKIIREDCLEQLEEDERKGGAPHDH